MSAILHFADEAENNIKNPKLLNDCLSNIQEIKNAAIILDELVKDLLEVSNQGFSNFSINLQKVDICAAINHSIKLNFSHANRRKIKITTVFANNIGAIKTDQKNKTNFD